MCEGKQGLASETIFLRMYACSSCASAHPALLRPTTALIANLFESHAKVFMTGLHWAAKRGHLDIVRILLQHGADVDSKDIIGRTPLYFAI